MNTDIYYKTFFLLFLIPFAAFAESSYDKPGKGPVKVFILAGQSNMEGHGMSEHIKMAAADPATKEEFGPLYLNGKYAVRKDVWISYANRRGDFTVGYGVSDTKVGPEIGFGWHMGEFLKEQVLIIKTCWGGHSLKEKFLPPGMGGPGPSYTKMLSEVKSTLANLKSHFPSYSEKTGYEITGLVWHQAWNDMIDGEQYGEKPAYKTYTERQAALLRDLRKEFNAPKMFMVIGELGAEASKHPKHVAFRKAQEATTLMPEFKDSTRFVKTCQFWDPDERFKANQGYHYNGNGKIYYFKGKAMAEAMYELMPKVSFEDLPSMLDAKSKPVYNAIQQKKFALASQALTQFKEHLEQQKASLDAQEFTRLENIYDLLKEKVSEVVDPALSKIKKLRANKDYYGISRQYSDFAKVLKGIREFDQLTLSLQEEIKKPEVVRELKLGRAFYDYILRIKKTEERYKGPRKEELSARYKRYLESKLFQAQPESIYARAAMKASAELQNPDNKVLTPEEYVSMTVKD